MFYRIPAGRLLLFAALFGLAVALPTLADPPVASNVDNDPGDNEAVSTDSTRSPAQSSASDDDADGDIDRITVGTHSTTPGGDACEVESTEGDSVDNDATESEVVVSDPEYSPGQSYGVDMDGDGDYDIIVVGTYSESGEEEGEVVTIGDVDGDGDDDVVVSDPNLPPGVEGERDDVDGDGDNDVYSVGNPGNPADPEDEDASMEGDLDNDGDHDILIWDDETPVGTDVSVDVDSDGDTDVTIQGSMPPPPP